MYPWTKFESFQFRPRVWHLFLFLLLFNKNRYLNLKFDVFLRLLIIKISHFYRYFTRIGNRHLPIWTIVILVCLTLNHYNNLFFFIFFFTSNITSHASWNKLLLIFKAKNKNKEKKCGLACAILLEKDNVSSSSSLQHLICFLNWNFSY